MEKFNKYADKVWYWFEENQYQNDGFGVYDKVMQFSDFIDECDDESLCSIAELDYETALSFGSMDIIGKLRRTIKGGIDEYFAGQKFVWEL